MRREPSALRMALADWLAAILMVAIALVLLVDWLTPDPPPVVVIAGAKPFAIGQRFAAGAAAGHAEIERAPSTPKAKPQPPAKGAPPPPRPRKPPRIKDMLEPVHRFEWDQRIIA